MNYFQWKTLFALLLAAAGITAAMSMLTLMGKPEKKLSARALRLTHRISGYTFYALAAILAGMGLRHLAAVDDRLPLRGVIHWVLGSLLILLLLLKLSVTRVYRKFLNLAPAMGMMVVTLALLVVTVSAVYYAVTGKLAEGAKETLVPVLKATPEGASGAPESTSSAGQVAQTAYGDPELGKAVFETYCASCHHATSTRLKIGPGLAGLFGRASLSVNGKSVSRESVREQIVAPLGGMPSFASILSEDELHDLVAYLETL